MKLLLDTNVILDNLARRDTFGESLQILSLCESGRLEGVVTTATVMDVMYVLRRYLPPAKARSAVQKQLQTVNTLPVLKSDLAAAFASPMRDFEDAVQASCAARAKADYIVTRNIKDFSESPVPAVTPAEMLERLKNL